MDITKKPYPEYVDIIICILPEFMKRNLGIASRVGETLAFFHKEFPGAEIITNGIAFLDNQIPATVCDTEEITTQIIRNKLHQAYILFPNFDQKGRTAEFILNFFNHLKSGGCENVHLLRCNV